MSLATDVRKRALAIIGWYESNRARGKDIYWSKPAYHPIAEGKYLLALAALVNAGVLSKVAAAPRVRLASTRLIKSARDFGREVGWGVGFKFRDTDSTHPNLLGSAIVVRGLAECAIEECAPEIALDLGKRGAEWLAEYVTKFRGPLAPPSEMMLTLSAGGAADSEPLLDAAANAYMALSACVGAGFIDAIPKESQNDIAAIAASCVPGLGWQFSPEVPAVGLLQSAYIAGALIRAGAPDIEERWFEAMCQLSDGTTFYEKAELLEADQARALHASSASYRLNPLGDKVVVRFPSLAQLSSAGEALTVIAEFARVGKWSTYWQMLARKLGGEWVGKAGTQLQYSEAQFPRFEMHFVHGLAGVLRTLRPEMSVEDRNAAEKLYSGPANEFPQGDFANFIAALQNAEIACVPVNEFAERFDTYLALGSSEPPAKPFGHLKFDIHGDISRPLQLARILARTSTPALFLMMPRHPLNAAIFDQESTWETLREIQGLGHEIGVHFDFFELIRADGDIYTGVERALDEFSRHGLSVRAATAHGDSNASIRACGLKVSDLFVEKTSPTTWNTWPPAEEPFLADHIGRYSYKRLATDFGISYFPEVYFLHDGKLLPEAPLYISDNRRTLSVRNLSGRRGHLISHTAWRITKEFTDEVVPLLKQRPFLALFHPQWYAPIS